MAARSGLPVRQGYGLTECGSVVSLEDDSCSAPGSAGVPLSHMRVHIAEDRRRSPDECDLAAKRIRREFAVEHLDERDGVEPRWRAVFDDKGRIQVAICHNMDLGDAWEWADSPDYPEKYASLAYRIGINYIVYSMTH